MKTISFKSLPGLVAAGGIALWASTALAQDSTATYTTPTTSTTAPAPPAAPQLGYGVAQIVQLQQAKVGDDTIIAYIKNSGNSYGLHADQIIYLRQQGVSSAVINTMLSQPTIGAVASAPAAPMAAPAAPAATYSEPVSAPTSIVGPSVSGIDPSAAAAASYYYYQPYYYPTYYPAYGYGYYPNVSLSFGWRGGWGGGWHGGGGFHGGWHH